jgi:hypothetical protein
MHQRAVALCALRSASQQIARRREWIAKNRTKIFIGFWPKVIEEKRVMGTGDLF